MKISLLVLLFVSAISVFGQSQSYGTASVGYPIMEHENIIYSLMSNVDISNIQLQPIFTVGLGKRFGKDKIVNLDLRSDFTFLFGKADYSYNYTWMVIDQGTLNYRFARLNLKPSIGLKITKKLNIHIGWVGTLNLSFHTIDGTRTTHGYYDGTWQSHPVPIIESIPSSNVTIPKISSGFSGMLSYSLNNKIEIFGSYISDNSGDDVDYMNTQSYSIGLNYYLKPKSQ